MQSRTAGGCTVPFSVAASLLAWQVRQSDCGGVVMSFTRVMSLFTRISWQLMQPIAMAEWTALPFDLSSWHSRHLAATVFLSHGTRGTAVLARESHSGI